jgi:ankyrin repeat protein
LQTKDVPQLEHDIRQSQGRIDELTDMLHAANHKYDDVTQPLIAQVADLTSHVKNLIFEITKRDQKIAALQIQLQQQRRVQDEDQECILDLKRSNEKLTLNIQRLVQSDICQAAKRGDFDLVSLWLTLGCDVNKRDHECVHIIAILQIIVSEHFSGNGHRCIGPLEVDGVILQSSWWSTKLTFMQKMTSKNMRILNFNYFIVCSRWEPLHWAASGGHSKLVNLLLSRNADVNARCKK